MSILDNKIDIDDGERKVIMGMMDEIPTFHKLKEYVEENNYDLTNNTLRWIEMSFTTGKGEPLKNKTMVNMTKLFRQMMRLDS